MKLVNGASIEAYHVRIGTILMKDRKQQWILPYA